MNSLKVFAALALIVLSSPELAYSHSVMSLNCDAAFVDITDGGVAIEVSPNGVDDTDNLQCALDAAVANKIPTVQLKNGTYYIGYILVENFKGTFQGKSIALTTIQVLENSIDCEGLNASGMGSTALKFRGGEPRLQFLTMQGYRPCLTDREIGSLIDFTGRASSDSICDYDIVHATVHRVKLDGFNKEDGPVRGIRAMAEAVAIEGQGCNTSLLGSFHLSRAELRNIGFALVMAMRSGAEANIAFNEFTDVELGVWLRDSNQNTTIFRNEFSGNSSLDQPFWGVAVDQSDLESAPSSTRVVIHKNAFDARSSFGEFSFGVSAWNDNLADISLLITDNTIKTNGSEARAIASWNVSKGYVSGNKFMGNGYYALGVFGPNRVANGWMITSNSGLGSYSSGSGRDFWLGITTTQCFVGPQQGASIRDSGTNNWIVSDGNFPQSFLTREGNAKSSYRRHGSFLAGPPRDRAK